MWANKTEKDATSQETIYYSRAARALLKLNTEIYICIDLNATYLTTDDVLYCIFAWNSESFVKTSLYFDEQKFAYPETLLINIYC